MVEAAEPALYSLLGALAASALGLVVGIASGDLSPEAIRGSVVDRPGGEGPGPGHQGRTGACPWSFETAAERRGHHGRVTTWMRCHWDEEDVWFYFEVDAEGWVIRQVELHGPGRTPLTAASFDEWRRAQETGDLAEYEKTYGITARLPVSQWEGHNPEELTPGKFEEVWNIARRQLTARFH